MKYNSATMSGWNKILDAICIQSPYSQKDILLAFDACGKSYDRLLVAIELSMYENDCLVEFAHKLRKKIMNFKYREKEQV